MSNFRINTCLLLILVLLWSGISFGQTESPYVSSALNNSSWADFMEETNGTFGVTYYLQTDSLSNLSMKIPSDTLLLLDVLKINFEPLGYKIAVEMGDRYMNALDTYKDIVSKKVKDNIFERHLKLLFM